MKINVVDWYDGEPEIIGVARTYGEAAAIRDARYEDTDGEANVSCYMGGKCIDHIVSLYIPYDNEDY